ncbi:tRNA wybutosine-synthesizing protein 3 homolog isoform X5 [Homalodisca vitripennis]|uniref:tRNA wybutosine-synthesizing protein 3 homolog isoform X5 n=1 Tax=Homalodisca vitripennis TaxID=197043 RepID=UPI001EEA4850|nr:tRNA wybutosine-synthesizing protein 3 homolog isoform X5 [Homalodisca vitripennis]XP_046677710.1 tRNA wybutosine-synthesizing protein 3 homolog isoform X5 [Homalodisca vitripennis]
MPVYCRGTGEEVCHLRSPRPDSPSRRLPCHRGCLCSRLSGRVGQSQDPTYIYEDGDSSKRGCKWILTSHTTVDSSEVLEKVKCCEKNMVLKFEPFILHVQCEDIIAAKKMQNCALAAGFRNSGSVFGRGGNITFAVRGTHGLEVPLSDEERLLVTDDYIRHIVDKANSKMCENMKKIENFSRAVHDLKTSKGHPGFETT